MEGFAPGTRKLLFDPGAQFEAERRFERAASWTALRQLLLGA